MAASWGDNVGSLQDLSGLAADSMWVTSQAAGNMMSGRPDAMSAPGSDPVDPLPPAEDQGNPHVKASNPAQVPPGTDGKPQASSQAGSPGLPAPSWKRTTRPDVIRKAAQ